jgi:hypothetical protein
MKSQKVVRYRLGGQVQKTNLVVDLEADVGIVDLLEGQTSLCQKQLRIEPRRLRLGVRQACYAAAGAGEWAEPGRFGNVHDRAFLAWIDKQDRPLGGAFADNTGTDDNNALPKIATLKGARLQLRGFLAQLANSAMAHAGFQRWIAAATRLPR